MGLGIVASLIPMFIEVWSARYLSPTVISIVSMVEVVSAAIIGVVAFDEVLDIFNIFGIALVLSSILIINIRISIKAQKYFEEHPEVVERLKEEYGPKRSDGSDQE
jgi:drug/metabolite transporter (DMT)-like permease